MRALLVLLVLSALQTPTPNWRELLVVYGDGVNLELLGSLTQRRDVTWLRAADATREDLARGHVALVGTRASNRFVRELAPAELAEWYERPGHVVQIARAHPWNPDARMLLVVGEIVAPLPRGRADVHVRRHGKTILLGFARDDGRIATRRFELAPKPALVSGEWRFFVHGADVTEDALIRLTVPGQRADVHVYRNLEEKGLITDDTRSAHVEDGAFHVVLGVDARPARLIAETFGVPGVPLLVKRGRAIVSTSSNAELAELDEIARRLLQTSFPPSPSALCDDERFEAESPFVTDPVSASFARFVGERPPDVPRLEREWRDALAKHGPARAPLLPPPSFQRGITYAHEGYRIHDGYLSARGNDSLARLAGLGADAVAIVPYAFMDDPATVVPLEVPKRAGAETDDDVIHAIRRARAGGMSVLLKPQIWVRRSWPGDIAPSSDEEAARFFREYRRWILHYALLADAHGVPLLAIGTELAKLSNGHRSRWASLIADIRAVYRGKLVYAANWGYEVRDVVFWDLLDYIGVDFYYPLSFDDRPSDEELARGFDRALGEIRELHRRYDKPVLLTEIGYASTKSPWKKPHASDREPELAPEDQARAYEIAFAAVADETDWIRGMYWWKWPTNLERGGRDHRGFTPSGKPAEDVLRRWYGSRLQ